MEILSGVLSVKQSAVLKHSYDKHWCILFHGVRTLSPRIDIYDRDPRAGKGSCKKTIYVESAAWKNIDTLEPAFSFEVKKEKQYIFYCSTVSERREWLLSLCCLSEGLFDTKHVVGVSNEGDVSPSSISSEEYSVVIQNDVYGGDSEVQTFFVLADQSDGCLKFHWQGIFKLSIGQGFVKLSDLNSGATIVQWKITELRNYGSSTQTIFVHAGKRSSTGEGKFTFRTTECSKIIGIIGRETKIIQENLNTVPHSASCTAAVSTGHPMAKPSQFRVTDEKKGAYLNMAPNISSSDCMNHATNTLEKGAKLPESTLGYQDQRSQVLRTVSNSSSNSTSTTAKKGTGDLKQQKAEKKLQKEEEKARQREEKTRKKEEKTRKREEEKLKKAERKKEKKSKEREVQNEPPQSEPDNVYTDAYEISSQDLQADKPSVHKPSMDCDYAEAGDFVQQARPVQPQIYNEPWGIKPMLGSHIVKGQTESIYAEPERKNIAKPKVSKDSNNQDTYSFTSDGLPPDIIPPVWEEEDSGSDHTNVYSQTNQRAHQAANDYGHVYGIASASAEFVPRNVTETGSNVNNVYESV